MGSHLETLVLLHGCAIPFPSGLPACQFPYPRRAESIECGFSNQVNSMKELYLLMEEEEMNAQHSDNKACTGDSWTQNTVCSAPSGPAHVHLIH